MASIKRRDVLIAGAAATTVISTAFLKPPFAAAAGEKLLTIYTPGLPQALSLARKDMRAAKNMHPLNGDVINFWNTRLANHHGALQGYTSWSDYVVLRGLAEERGLRLRSEKQMITDGKRTLFRWLMA